jgi:hypothetical protein
MISFGAKKADNTAALEQVKRWSVSALANSSLFSADVTLMVAEIECKEPGCPPVETIVSILDPSNPQKVKIIKGVAAVTESDVRAAFAAAPFALSVQDGGNLCKGGHGHGHGHVNEKADMADGESACSGGNDCSHAHGDETNDGGHGHGHGHGHGKRKAGAADGDSSCSGEHAHGHETNDGGDAGKGHGAAAIK